MKKEKKEKSSSLLKLFGNIKAHKIIFLTSSIVALTIIGISIIFLVGNKKTDEIISEEMCVVQFETNGGTAIEQETVKCGDTVTKPKDPEKEGFDFKYWQYNGKEYNFNDPVLVDLLLQAYYEVNDEVDTVTISFDTSGGSTITDIEIIKGGILTKPVDPVMYGYKFLGWTLNGKYFDFSAAITEEITLVALWKKEDNNVNNQDFVIENTNSGMCQYSLEGARTDKYSIELYNGQPININYAIAFNPLWSYSSGCELKYTSTNENIATVDETGLIKVLNEGDVVISSCIYEKASQKKLGCFDGTVSSTNFENTYFEDPKISYEDIKGKWYAKYSNVSYIEFSNYYIEESSNYQLFNCGFYGINENDLDYSCKTGKCIDSTTIVGGTIISSNILDFENKYSMELKEDILTLSINGNTVEFYRNKSNVPIESFSINKKSETINIGEQTHVSAFVYPNNSTVNEVIWTNSNPAVAKIYNQKHLGDTNKGSMTTAYIEGLAEGTTVLTATTKDGKHIEEFILNVKNINVKVSSVQLNKTELTISKGSTFNLIATINPNNAANKDLVWSSSNDNVATVDKNGKVIAKSKGTTVITVKTVDGNKTANCTVTVNNPPLTAKINIGISTISSSEGIVRGIKTTITANGGTGNYDFYYIKLYRDNTLIAQTTDTNDNSLFVIGYTNGNYYAQIEVRDSDETIYTGISPITTISGF